MRPRDIISEVSKRAVEKVTDSDTNQEKEIKYVCERLVFFAVRARIISSTHVPQCRMQITEPLLDLLRAPIVLNVVVLTIPNFLCGQKGLQCAAWSSCCSRVYVLESRRSTDERETADHGMCITFNSRQTEETGYECQFVSFCL